jgi:hypothetical protein
MPVNESIPVYEPADRVSAICVGAVRGKRFVDIAADIPGGPLGTELPRVSECGAGIRPVGVACYDGADGDLVPLHNDHSWVLMPAGAAIVAGNEIMSDSQGRPTPWVWAANGANRPCGKAISTQATVGSDVLIKLYS